eukprot:TRINITY_DN15814_c0_g3_i2.p2 TRINITY_DN15814_c0_g3~~TRINITY_DN15814_c0_g3_i2.p2  ORF type:complete len:137 (+),score=14.24 TRINITY_DN15814_c0_g3_i2:674-1084(+)
MSEAAAARSGPNVSIIKIEEDKEVPTIKSIKLEDIGKSKILAAPKTLAGLNTICGIPLLEQDARALGKLMDLIYDEDGKHLLVTVLKMVDKDFGKQVKTSPDWFVQIVKEHFENDFMVSQMSPPHKALYKKVIAAV